MIVGRQSCYRRTMVPRIALIGSLLLGAQQVSGSPVSDRSAVAAGGPHRLALGSQSLAYKAVAGFLEVPGRVSGSGARIFYVAYMRTDVDAAERRPIMFAWNGGPGGSSAGVHIGAFGPQAVAAVDPGNVEAGDARLVDNPDTLLGASDLVFIDPVGAGYSRLAPGTTAADFYGVRQDAAATAAFVAAFLKREGREEAPLYLLGESYGTLRAVLAARLLQQQGVAVRGLVLMGLILDNTTLFPQAGNDEPYWLFLPTEAAIAAYHGRAEPSAPASDPTSDARHFAYTRYVSALALGSGIDAPERAELAAVLGRLTGLTPQRILDADLRVTADRFAHDLIGAGRVVSRADGRVVGPDRGAGPSGDPLYAAMLPRYQQAIIPYLRDRLGLVTTTPYTILDTKVADAWQWGDTPLGSPTALSVGDTLRDALRADAGLRVFVGSGTFDLTSPVLAAEYTVAHLGLKPAEKQRVTMHEYASGHMIYVSQPARHELSSDIIAFVRGAAAPGSYK